MTSRHDIIDIDGIPVHVATDGPEDAPALTFAHALSLDLRSFEPQVAAFRDRWRVVRLDLRGHGRTDPDGGAFSIEDLAGDVAGVLDRLCIQRTHFVGSSLGAMAGLALAFGHRDRLASLTFMASQGALPPERIVTARAGLAAMRASGATPATTLAAEADAMLARLLGDTDEAAAPETFALLRRILGETTLFGQARAYEAIFDMDYDGRLAEIATPTLVLAGAADSSTPPERMRMYGDGIAGARMVVLEGAGHFPNVERPAAFNQALAAFLDGPSG
ncbi:MAG: alpha/beta fold hydrolase [Rickettsiales bacterium]